MSCTKGPWPLFALALMIPMIVTGCGDSPTGSPVPLTTETALGTLKGPGSERSSQGLYFPLTVGNRWVLGRTLHFTTITPETTTTFEEMQVVERELTGTEGLLGREYVRQVEQVDGVEGQIVRYRQDRSGLYEADVSANPASSAASSFGRKDPLSDFRDRGIRSLPTVALRTGAKRLFRRHEQLHEVLTGDGQPGASGSMKEALHAHGWGALKNEITRLSYPLGVGQTWTVREAPFFGSEVEAREVLELPAGHFPAARIRIESEIFSGQDEVLVWFGRCGQLALFAHLVAEVTDSSGNVVGTLILEEDVVLTGIDIIGRPNCTPSK